METNRDCDPSARQADGFFMRPGEARSHATRTPARVAAEPGASLLPVRLAAVFLFLLVSSTAFAPPAFAITGTASWFDSASACPHNPDPRCPMANGRSLYDQERTHPYFAASWDYALNAVIRVTDPSGNHLDVVVTDRGPARRLYRQGRLLDLSKVAFQALAPLEVGVIPITVEEIRDGSPTRKLSNH